MFPVHAKCVTLDAGWEMERANAKKCLEIGKVYTIRSMVVGQSSTSLEFYEVKGHWNSVFFDACPEANTVYVVCSEANNNGPEAVFTDEDEAYNYSTMGDMWLVSLKLNDPFGKVEEQ